MEMPRNRKRITLASLAILLFLALLAVVWYCWPNQRVAAVKRLRAQLSGEAGGKLTPDQRRELGSQIRNKIRQFTPLERRELDEERREQLRRYFSLSKKDKIAYLDQQIKRMETARGQWQANQRANNANFGPRIRTLDPEERDKRRRERLDLSTAEDRADRAQFRKDLQQRRAQLGLAPMAGPWGRRGRAA
jgi:hypothetical protein